MEIVKKILSRLPLIGALIFFYVPIFILLKHSFNNALFPSPWRGFTFEWYEQLLTEEEVWTSLLTSLNIAFISTALVILLSILYIYLLSQQPKYSRWVKGFYINILLPETLLGIAYISFFQTLNLTLGLFPLIIAHSTLGLGIAIPLLYNRYKSLNPKELEASYILGGSQKTTFIRVTLPHLRPTIFALILLQFVFSFDDYILSFFCSGSQIQPLSIYIASCIRLGFTPILNALSLLLITVSIGLSLLFFSLDKKGSHQ